MPSATGDAMPKRRTVLKNFETNYLLALEAEESEARIVHDTWRDYDKWVDQWGNITD